MMPNWKISDLARRRLAEMAKAGLTEQTISESITLDGDRWVLVYVEALTPQGTGGRISGSGTTIGQAVAEAYPKWKTLQS